MNDAELMKRLREHPDSFLSSWFPIVMEQIVQGKTVIGKHEIRTESSGISVMFNIYQGKEIPEGYRYIAELQKERNVARDKELRAERAALEEIEEKNRRSGVRPDRSMAERIRFLKTCET